MVTTGKRHSLWTRRTLWYGWLWWPNRRSGQHCPNPGFNIGSMGIPKYKCSWGNADNQRLYPISEPLLPSMTSKLTFKNNKNRRRLHPREGTSVTICYRLPLLATMNFTKSNKNDVRYSQLTLSRIWPALPSRSCLCSSILFGWGLWNLKIQQGLLQHQSFLDYVGTEHKVGKLKQGSPLMYFSSWLGP
jgi:hypothetical protein